MSSSIEVYNDADILEKILSDKRRELGPATDDEDMMSPKFKIRMFFKPRLGRLSSLSG